jgi:cytochrome c oxidase subunit 2
VTRAVRRRGFAKTRAAAARIARVGLVALPLTVSACMPRPVTTEGRDVATLYSGFFALAVVVAAIVFGLTTFAIIRHRRRGSTELPPQTSGNWKLEAIWTAIPIVTVLVLFGATLLVLARMEPASARPGTEIRVEAFRWGWTFRYPSQGIVVSGIGSPGPELVVPVNQPVRITLAAADVAHAFYVPQFLFKRDAIPGRESTFDFTVADAGTYRGQCAEFCGIYHSRMPFAVRAVPRAEFDAWIAAQPRQSGAPSGAGPAGPGSAAPSGSGLATLAPGAP